MHAMAPDDSTPEVLTSLPRTRPQRRSAKRDAVKAKPAAKKAPAKPRATAAKPKAAKPAAKAKPRAARKPPVREAPPRGLPAAGFAPPKDDGATRPAPGAVELVGTAIQAAGELVQIGAAIGGQALKSALGRIGRD